MRSALIVVTMAVSACGGGGGSTSAPAASPAPTAAATAAADVKTHDIRGRIEGIGAARTTVTLDHEAIPGVMEAMKMEYQVQDPAVLAGLKVGDQVQGQFEIRSGNQYVITRLRK